MIMAILKTKKADLNIHYKKYFQISMIIVLALLIAAFKFSPRLSQNKLMKDDVGCIINIFEIPQTDQNKKPLLPPRPQLPEIATVDAIEDIEFATTDIEIDADLAPPARLEKPSTRIVEDDNAPFVAAEVMPDIVGGLESIQKNIYYTDFARRAEIEGKVIIEFIVGKSGDVEDAKIFKGIFDELDMIALNAVKQAKFTPGLQRGKAVRVRMWMPIVFKLK
jgi:periplasmic protein TonB